MDLLFSRYASPFILLDQMIQTGNLFAFINKLKYIKDKEAYEKKEWDVWLHRVFDKSFSEFKKVTKKTTENEETVTYDRKYVTDTIARSRSILKRFRPI